MNIMNSLAKNRRINILSLLLALLAYFVLGGCETAKPRLDETNATLAKINRADDFKTASEALVKYDQPLRAFAIMEKLAKEQKYMRQLETQMSTFLGRDSWTRRLANTGWPTFTPDKNVSLAELQAVDAIEEIVAASKSYRVVILNEGHDSQRQRAFAHLLAMALRRAGASTKTPPLMSTPFFAAAASAATMLTGVEITSAHGQAITSSTSAR